MKRLAWILKWLLYGAIFFTFFAFALNNQQDATLRFFFGTQWRMPMALVVLAAFAAGLVIGIIAMVPRWWKQRSAVKRLVAQPAPAVATAPAKVTAPLDHGV